MNEIMEMIINISILGWAWNLVIFFKNLVDVSGNIRPGFNEYRYKNVKILKVIYSKGYIPYYTLFKYRPFMDGYLEYKKLHPNSDAIDYIHYLSLDKYSGDIK